MAVDLITFEQNGLTATTYNRARIDALLKQADTKVGNELRLLRTDLDTAGTNINALQNNVASLTTEVGKKMTKTDFVGSDGKIVAAVLPSFVDDVLEYASFSEFPKTGEGGKIYVDKAKNKTYRWGGTTYTEISPSLALGETSDTAYSGSAGRQNREDIDNILGLIEEAIQATTLADYGITDAYTKAECDRLFANNKVTKIYESGSSTNYKTYADIAKLQSDMQTRITMVEDTANNTIKITF